MKRKWRLACASAAVVLTPPAIGITYQTLNPPPVLTPEQEQREFSDFIQRNWDQCKFSPYRELREHACWVIDKYEARLQGKPPPPPPKH